MSEINQSSENLKIPENWNFPEKNEQGLKLIQIDPEERFLALTVPDGKGHKSVEYFFGAEGNVSGYLIVPSANSPNNIDVGLTSDIKVIYNITRNTGSGLHPLTPMEIYVFLISDKDHLMDPEFEEMLGDFYYRSGELCGVMVDSTFAEEKSHIESPRFFLQALNYNASWTSPDFGFDVNSPRKYDSSKKEFDTGNFVLRGVNRQKLDVVDKDKKQVFEIEFGRESDRGEHRRQSLFISQKHTPTGIIKTLRAPLKIDLQKVAEILNSKLPHNKERVAGKDRLVVPWRDIDRIVGARLSYSYPPQTSEK